VSRLERQWFTRGVENSTNMTSVAHPDEQPGSYFLELKNHFFAFFGVKILKFFDEDPGSEMETVRIRDPGLKKVGSGINIPDPPH
jgi:hypothetical protein